MLKGCKWVRNLTIYAALNYSEYYYPIDVTKRWLKIPQFR